MGTLIDKSEIKNSIDVDHTDFDTLIDNLIDETEADLQGFVETPITKKTFTEKFDGGGEFFVLSKTPIDPDSVTVTDLDTKSDSTDDETVDSKKYRVLDQEGIIQRATDSGGRRFWKSGIQRFQVQYDAGLDQLDEWDNYHKLRLKTSIRQLVVHRFEREDPGIERESLGGGVSRAWGEESIPPEILRIWNKYRDDL